MRRREFLSALGGAAALPLAARAQERVPVIGYLANASPAGFAHFLAAFKQGLGELNFVEHQTIGIEYRWAEGQHDRLAPYAAELVTRRVAAIMATGGVAPAQVAKAATTTIPIVFTGGSDPVRAGLVTSLNRPGGNATGVINISTELTAKRLDLLRDIVPDGTLIAVLFNPNSPDASSQVAEIEQAARKIGQRIHAVHAASESEFEPAFAALVERRAGGLFVSGDPLFTTRRAKLVALATQHRIPASYSFRDFPLAGGLMSYGANLNDVHRQAGVYVGRVLKGEKPADLPVVQPTRFVLVINLKTAKALGITVPAKLLALADEVIE